VDVYCLWDLFLLFLLWLFFSDGYVFGDVNIIRFILLVLMFVVSVIFLIVSPNVISILLGWDGLDLVRAVDTRDKANVDAFGENANSHNHVVDSYSRRCQGSTFGAKSHVDST
jgi:hypothetical protein